MRHKQKWNVAWRDRGHGHGDYGIINEAKELIAEIKTGMREHAELIAKAPEMDAEIKCLKSINADLLVGIRKLLKRAEEEYKILTDHQFGKFADFPEGKWALRIIRQNKR